MDEPTLTMLVGLPGAGKSTFAKQSSQTIIAVDDFLRASGTGKHPTSTDNRNAREQALSAVIKKLKANQSVIYDHTNLTPPIRNETFRALSAAGLKTPVVAYFCDTDFFTCVRQNQNREFDLSPLNLLYLTLTLVPPVKTEGFAKITTKYVQNPLPTSPSLLKLLNSPTVENLNPDALLNEIVELKIYSAGLAQLGEDWAVDLLENFGALLDNCNDNTIELSQHRELIVAWLFKDLFRIVTEYFAVNHPETELPTGINLNKIIFERVLKPRFSTYSLDLTIVKNLLTGYFATAEQDAKPPKGLTEKLLTILLVS